MKVLSTNVADDVLDDVDQAVKFIDRRVEKLGISCKVLRDRMKMRRGGLTKKERGIFNKLGSALLSLDIYVHQNEVAFKRSNNSTSSEPNKGKKSNSPTTKAKAEDAEDSKGGKKSKKLKRDNTEWTNSKPFRSPQCRYAPTQGEFIVRTIRELEAVSAI